MKGEKQFVDSQAYLQKQLTKDEEYIRWNNILNRLWESVRPQITGIVQKDFKLTDQLKLGSAQLSWTAGAIIVTLCLVSVCSTSELVASK